MCGWRIPAGGALDRENIEEGKPGQGYNIPFATLLCLPEVVAYECAANAALLTFTYYENYIDLVRMELNAIASVTKGVRPRTYAILGSGPLPMTSICILQALRNNSEAVTVHNFDRDPWVISKSSELGRKLGYTPKEVEFHCTDIQDRGLDLREFDVVYLASLVGVTNQEKQDAISSTVKQMSQKALLVLRSAHLLRSLLYPVRRELDRGLGHTSVC